MTSPGGEQFGPYTVYEQIGMGGMATVHRAETTGLAGFRKAVALKRMLPSIASNEEFVRSFVREARLASHLRHSNVAQTYDLGKVGEVYFIAMELVNGRTLRDMLRQALESRTRIPIPISLHILNQICDALDYAHNLCNESGAPLGIIHRDVSPSNVIVSDAGIVKLIDFGIAKASTSSLQVQTMSGVIKGKFSYIAPEYIAGQIDARADLFAVGIVAYELLTGCPLFKGKNDMDTLDRVQTMPIPPPSTINPDIPPAIDSIVMTALQRNPDLRWQRASAMRIALTTELSRLGITTSDRQLAEWVETASASRVPVPVPEVDSQPPTQLLRVSSESRPGNYPRDSAPSIVVEVVREEPHALPAAPIASKITEPQAVPIFSSPRSWATGTAPDTASTTASGPASATLTTAGPASATLTTAGPASATLTAAGPASAALAAGGPSSASAILTPPAPATRTLPGPAAAILTPPAPATRTLPGSDSAILTPPAPAPATRTLPGSASAILTPPAPAPATRTLPGSASAILTPPAPAAEIHASPPPASPIAISAAATGGATPAGFSAVAPSLNGASTPPPAGAELFGPSAPTAELPPHPATRRGVEPPALPAAPAINHTSELQAQAAVQRTKPRFGRSLEPSPALAGRVPTNPHRAAKSSIILWILVSAAVTAGVIYFALPFLL